MKTRIMILSSLLCMYGMSAGASECIGAGCDIIQFSSECSDCAPTIIAQDAPTTAPQMHQVKLLSIKPVPADSRPSLYDGTTGEYKTRSFDKTVDWRDGVPIWDDSISSYRDKDFSDWFLEPLDELYIRDASPTSLTDMYAQNMADAASTRARIEEILTPVRPQSSLWTDSSEATHTCILPRPEYTAQDLTPVVTATFGPDDDCPFQTETECAIFRRKPMVRETVSPRSPTLRASQMRLFIDSARCDSEISANSAVSAPLLARYKMLMSSANACCTDGMAYALKRAGASDALVYKFLSDDANFYGFGARCLMMTDAELDRNYPNTATSAVIADVRNGCLCRGRQWFSAMLAPFKAVYQELPSFAESKFYYTYTDGLQRQITVSVNNDVQNVLRQLEMCP